MAKFPWAVRGGQAGFYADMPDDVTLYATPDQTVGFMGKPKRGTTWRAGASQFDGKFTISRFGRDCYGTQFPSAKAAMREAEAVYLEAV